MGRRTRRRGIRAGARRAWPGAASSVSSRGRPDPVAETAPRNALVGLDIAGPRRVDNVFGQRGRRIGAVAVLAGVGASQPVSDELLVEAVLGDALVILVGGPVPRRIGGEHLVGQHQVAVLV